MGSVQRVVALDKDGKNMGCVYCATNTVNGKKYVGKTSKSLRIRINDHMSQVNRLSNNLFHNAIRKYGKEKFRWVKLYESICNQELLDKEVEYIQNLMSLAPRGYNLTIGGEGVTGFKWSEETKQKFRNPKPETREKQRIARLGKSLSDITKQKISDKLCDPVLQIQMQTTKRLNTISYILSNNITLESEKERKRLWCRAYYLKTKKPIDPEEGRRNRRLGQQLRNYGQIMEDV